MGEISKNTIQHKKKGQYTCENNNVSCENNSDVNVHTGCIGHDGVGGQLSRRHWFGQFLFHFVGQRLLRGKGKKVENAEEVHHMLDASKVHPRQK